MKKKHIIKKFIRIIRDKDECFSFLRFKGNLNNLVYLINEISIIIAPTIIMYSAICLTATSKYGVIVYHIGRVSTRIVEGCN